MKPKEQITFPDGADRSLLKRFSKRAMVEQEKRFKRNHEALLRRAKAFGKQMDLNEDATKAVNDRLRRIQRLTSKNKPPKFVPLEGHNPARYAPFDLSSSFFNCGGLGPYDVCQCHGPHATTGEIGADLFNYASLSETSDAMSTMSSVGFWFYSSEAGTLHVTAQAYIFGAASATDETYAGLELSVENFPIQNVPLAGPSATSQNSITDIFRSDVSASALPSGDPQIIVGVGGFFDSFWEGRTMSVLAPVRPHNWYLIRVSALQHVVWAGMSSFDIYVGPIAYFLV